MKSLLGATNLNRLVVFAAVVQSGSLTAAASRLGIAKTTVSTHIRRLEQEVGANLLMRTTRRISLTDAGKRFFESCRTILRDAESAILAAGQSSMDLSGTLRITAPVDYGASVVAPVLTSLQRDNPTLRIELLSDDRLFDLVAEGVDVAIRLGTLKDSSLRAVRIAIFELWLVAHPSLLKESAGIDPGEAAELPFAAFSVLPRPTTWQFSGPRGAVRSVQFRPAITSNTALATRSMALGGCAAILPDFMVRRDLAEQRLVRLFPRWRLPSGGVYAVFPTPRHRPEKVRAFVNALTRHVKILSDAQI